MRYDKPLKLRCPTWFQVVQTKRTSLEVALAMFAVRAMMVVDFRIEKAEIEFGLLGVR